MPSLNVLNIFDLREEVKTTHYVNPDLKEMTNCSFYWGKIDQHEAKTLLEGKPPGTFLIRDSAQENYLFTVSAINSTGCLRHARIENLDNRFSFYPQEYQSPTVSGLFEHYRTNSCIMLDTMLIEPHHRNFPFDLKTLARATIGRYLNKDSISTLSVPEELKRYLMEYHNKQRARETRPRNWDGFIAYSLSSS